MVTNLPWIGMVTKYPDILPPPLGHFHILNCITYSTCIFRYQTPYQIGMYCPKSYRKNVASHKEMYVSQGGRLGVGRVFMSFHTAIHCV